MAKKKGTVSKAAKGKFGYFLMLDGNDFYYNTKFKPKCGEGDIVGIEFTPKGDTRGQIQSVKVLEDNSGGYDKSNSESGGGSSSSGGGGSGGGRQDSIVWQSCQKVASWLLPVLIEQGAVISKGKPDEKLTQIMGQYDALTYRLFVEASDPRNGAAFKENADISDESGEDSEEEASDDDDWDDDDEWS